MKLAIQVVLTASLALAALEVPAQAGKTTERRYGLGDRGFLVLNMPRGWKDETREVPAGEAPSITFVPESGPLFGVLLSPVWPADPKAAPPGAGELRRGVLAVAQPLKGRTVERAFTAMEISGPSAHGFYFSATERAPKAGEYKYMNQGVILLGNVRVTFTILTNDGQRDTVRAALEMLRTARLVKAEAPGAAAAPAPVQAATK